MLYIRTVHTPPPLMNPIDSASHGDRWYVYLLALMDCSAFKAGFSCNPFHRAFAFSHRYFEQFDLHESLFARMDSCDAARKLEAEIKSDLATYRSECPPWVPIEAGGHTEWFDAAHLGYARTRLQALDDGSRLITASDFIRMELQQQTASFELWAVHQASFIAQALSSSVDAHMALRVARSLRDWLDAYRNCGIALFTDDPAVLAFVKEAVGHAARPVI